MGDQIVKIEGKNSTPVHFAMLLTALLLPLNGFAAEPAIAVLPASAIDMTLPIHQQKKLHPELSDPVLGDQAQIVEWAWSPQYAKRFNQSVQPDGLKDGGLWLIGVKVQRVQNDKWQMYRCSIIGLVDNRLEMLAPPGEQYMIHPGYTWGGLPLPGNMAEGIRDYTPGQTAWFKQPRNKREESLPVTGITLDYLMFYRHFQPELAYFEIEGACGYFRDPQTYRNEIRFPTKVVHVDSRKIGDIRYTEIKNENSVRFVIPDGLMRRIYPYIQDAYDWGSCFMRRVGGQSNLLTDHALKTKRFGNTCEPAVVNQKNR